MSSVLENGHAESNGEPSAAEKLAQSHVGDHKVVFVEEVPDEDELKHGEPPVTGSVLEAVDEPEEIPVKLPAKQKAAPSLDTQSDVLFPSLGGGPKAHPAPTWGPAAAKGANGANGSSANIGTDSGPAPAAPKVPSLSNGGPRIVNIPGKYTDQIVMEPKHILPRNQLKKPVADVLREVNKKSKANVSSSSSANGTIFSASGPTESSCRDALNAIAEAIGTKVHQSMHF